MEKYSSHEYELIRNSEGFWGYEIYGERCPDDCGSVTVDGFYDTKEEARFAAVGHIYLLEQEL